MKKLFYLVISLIGLLYAVEAFSAAFTSAIATGNWNDGATWGNTSPGVKGTDWPGTAGDTFTVSSGHTVTYNVIESNALGNSTVNGTLYFSRSTTTLLTFGASNTLTIANGGWVNIGATGDEIPSAVVAEVVGNRAGDGTFINIASGGKLTAWGDSAYYGSDAVTTLANSAENTDGDVDIVTTDDMSAKWVAGQLLLVQIKSSSPSATPHDEVFGTAFFTISAISGTTITSTATTITADAGVGSSWTAEVFNLSRNVIIREDGSTTTIGSASTTNLGIIDANTTTLNVIFEDVRMHATYYSSSVSASTAPGATFTNCTNHNSSKTILNNMNNVSWTGADAIIASNTDGIALSVTAPVGFTVGGYILACVDAFDGSDGYNQKGLTVTASIIGCQYCFNDVDGLLNLTSDHIACCAYVFSGTDRIIAVGIDFWGNDFIMADGVDGNSTFTFRNCNFYENSEQLFRIAYAGTIYLYNVKLGWDDADTSRPNTGTDDIEVYTYGRGTTVYAYNVKMESGETEFNVSFTNTSGYASSVIYSEHHNQVLNAQLTQTPYAIIEKVACDGTGDRPTQDPDGGTSYTLEIRSLQSTLDFDNGICVLKQRFWKTAAAYTVTYKVQTTTAGLDQDQLRINCYYPSTLGAGTVGYATDTGTVATRTGTTDWTQDRACTFTSSEEGWVTVEIWLNYYEASDEVWIWPEPTWS